MFCELGFYFVRSNNYTKCKYTETHIDNEKHNFVSESNALLISREILTVTSFCLKTIQLGSNKT